MSSVGRRLLSGGGVVDPVQDDEAHAGDHDHQAQQEEGSGLGGGEGRKQGGETVFVSNSCSYEANDHFIC